MKVCVVGAAGYIGSVLANELKYDITPINQKTEYTDSFVKSFNVIIYLGGGSSNYSEVLNDDIAELAKLMDNTQLLIYASTAAVYEGLILAKETDFGSNLNIYPESMLAREKIISSFNINSIGLRLGSVVGLSSKQRSDRIHIQMLKTALFEQTIYVQNPLANRAILSMTDLISAFNKIITNPQVGHKIYNLSSYNTTVTAIASSIAIKTNAKVIYLGSGDLTKGFTMDTTNFCQDYQFGFKSTDESIINQLLLNQDKLLNSWLSNLPTVKSTNNCFCCDNNQLITLLDLGLQPLANNFVKLNQTCNKYPLKVYRCPKCFHQQLSHIVPPSELFDDYIYVTGISQTMHKYSEEFCNRFNNFNKLGTVLDIACNDGTQLDKFKVKGWTTFGVDPAQNLAQQTINKGHKIVVGFWGDDSVLNQFLKLSFDLIIAQNVFAHVPNPKLFLDHCYQIMSDDTILCIQTSQAEILQHGEFDTIYHEHLSFFTVNSMKTLAERCNLKLTDVEKVAIHGISYLFTLAKQSSEIATKPSVNNMLAEEQDIYSNILPLFYQGAVNKKKFLLTDVLNRFKNSHYSIVGFGASAKGNTLLNFLGNNLPEYIIDESILKQGLLTPGTYIPVYNYEHLKSDTRSLAILILAWNFLPEIKEKIRLAAKKDQKICLIVPFPYPKILVLKGDNWIDMTYLEKSDNKVKTLLITHFYNEEFLLPYWIMHHAPMFDEVVLINYDSTDKSLEIIKNLAPSHWKVITSRNRYFSATAVDVEVRDIEKTYPNEMFKIALTVTEFLVWPGMKSWLAENNSNVFKVHASNIAGDDNLKLVADLPLIRQRAQYTNFGQDYSRFIHRGHQSNNFYVVGRHKINTNYQSVPEAIIFKYCYSPWLEMLPRKLQIGGRQPKSDIDNGLGFQHQFNLDQLTNEKNNAMSQVVCDLINCGDNNDSELLKSKILYNSLGVLWSSRG